MAEFLPHFRYAFAGGWRFSLWIVYLFNVHKRRQSRKSPRKGHPRSDIAATCSTFADQSLTFVFSSEVGSPFFLNVSAPQSYSYGGVEWNSSAYELQLNLEYGKCDMITSSRDLSPSSTILSGIEVENVYNLQAIRSTRYIIPSPISKSRKGVEMRWAAPRAATVRTPFVRRVGTFKGTCPTRCKHACTRWTWPFCAEESFAVCMQGMAIARHGITTLPWLGGVAGRTRRRQVAFGARFVCKPLTEFLADILATHRFQRAVGGLWCILFAASG